MQFYSIYDKKSQSFERPFFVKHVAEATRSVESAFEIPKDKAPWFIKYPDDHALYLIGTFDPGTGGILPPTTLGPEFVMEVAALAPKGGVA